MKYPEFDRFRTGYSFDLDEFQVEACEALAEGHGVLVCAPTGSGKTVVGEFAVHLALASGQKCFYTTPIKALSNQKFNDLVQRHGPDSVGLLTGDNAINAGAPIVVMTTEVLRNMLYAASASIQGLGYVVMDEVHYLGDRFRGAVWEEVIIHLPQSVRLVSLSATVSNAEEFGEWLVTVRGDTRVVVHEERPVPLWQHMMVGTRLFDLFAGDGATMNTELRRYITERMRYLDPALRGARPTRGWRPPHRPDVIARLDREGLLPLITFIFSRAGCDAAVRQCVLSGMWLTEPGERDEITAVVEERTAGIPVEDLDVLGYWEWLDGLRRGVAAHHAGLIPTFKETVEELFVRGLVRVVFATETLALGINMPARTVVLERLSKFNGDAHADITPGEYTQLTGRAGRRGIDVEGHAVVLWSPEADPARVAGLASTRTYPLLSSFRPSYNMAVNLVGQMGRPEARELLDASFAQFQADRSVAGLVRQIRRNEETMRDYAARMHCDRGDFTEYSALRRELSEREAERARAGARPARHRRRIARGAALGRCYPGAQRTTGRPRGGTRPRRGAARRPAPARADRGAMGRTAVPHRLSETRGSPRDGARPEAVQPSLAAGPARPGLDLARAGSAAGAAWSTQVHARRGRRSGRGAADGDPSAPMPPVPRPGDACPVGGAVSPAAARNLRTASAHRGPHELPRAHLRPHLRAARRPRLPGRGRDDASRAATVADLVGVGSAGGRVSAFGRMGRPRRGGAGGRSVHSDLRGSPRRAARRPDADLYRSRRAGRHESNLGRPRGERGRPRPAAHSRAAARLRVGGLPVDAA
jgi:superfamily II DNA/RNA helicase